MKLLLALVLTIILLAVLPPASAQEVPRGILTPENGSQLIELIRLGRGATDRVAYSPDGGTIAVLSSVGVWLYPADTLNTPTEPPFIVTTDDPGGLAYMPDGGLLAISVGQKVELWNPATLELAASFDAGRTASSLAFSPDGMLLAVNLGSSGVLLWDMVAGVAKATISGSIQGDAELVFSPDGTLLAGSTTDYKVHLWRATDGTEAAVISGHTRYVYDFVFSPDTSVLVTASYDESVRLWDVASGAELGALAGTDAQRVRGAFALAASPDGNTLVSGHNDGLIVVWDVNAKAPGRVFGLGAGDVRDLAFNADGSQLVSVSTLPSLTLWDFAAGTEIASAVGHTPVMTAIAFSPDSAQLAVGGYDETLSAVGYGVDAGTAHGAGNCFRTVDERA
ncbi:MAG: WD40 repeat domain-containing protein [Chloroflexi bacterium]|nr:WD40 repeat domain-containing protein [Chloroflexota bacterium]